MHQDQDALAQCVAELERRVAELTRAGVQRADLADDDARFWAEAAAGAAEEHERARREASSQARPGLLRRLFAGAGPAAV